MTEHYLTRIERLDPGLGAFVTVTADAARTRADRLGHLVPTSRPLWGLPSADKDLYDRAGVPTRSGTASLPERPAGADHPLVAALDAAGTVSLGKTTSPEFGMSSSSETRFGVTRNPYDTGRAPGGSSSGAAVAVAAGLLPAAVGSDGGVRSGSRPPRPDSSASSRAVGGCRRCPVAPASADCPSPGR